MSRIFFGESRLVRIYMTAYYIRDVCREQGIGLDGDEYLLDIFED